MGVRRVDRAAQGGDGVGVLRPHVDVALAGPDGVRRDRHALDEGERVALDDHPVRERAGVALVEVAGHELQVGGGLEDGLPLDAGREAGAPAAAQPGVGDLLDHLGRGQRQRAAQPGPAAVGLVVGDRRRVDHADAGEADPPLRRQPGVLVDDADAARGRRSSRRPTRTGRRRRRASTLAKPTRPASVSTSTSGSSQSMPRDPLRTTLRAGRLEGGGDLVGADRDRGGVAGDEDPAGRASTPRPPSARRAARADSRPCRRPSSVPDGPSAQLPRQNTSSTSTSAPRSPAAAARLGVQRLGTDRLAGLAAAERDGVRGGRCGAEVVVEA